MFGTEHIQCRQQLLSQKETASFQLTTDKNCNYLILLTNHF